MKFAWLTDTHLNFLHVVKRKQYYDEIKRNCHAIVIMSAEAQKLASEKTKQMLSEMPLQEL